MAENAQLHRPAAGQSDVVPVGPDAKLEFTFDQTDANLGKDGQDLVLSFDDGATLRLQGFYDNFGEGAQPPTLVVEGQDLPGEAFLAALNDPALMPLAGPGAGAAAAMLGGGAYEEALLHGVSGVDRLEKLAFDGWGRDSEHDEQYRGLPGTDGGPPELPGGTFGLAGNSYDMNGVFVTSG
ncbi:MAG: hypothetical protein FWG59_03185, partial [Betaproteobacteria bacterium]|nr:hypothetical protein [Betaproteobacteria bacterium]